jgi:tRNA nucleotidyltransferase (CCA-adding enzyme)
VARFAARFGFEVHPETMTLMQRMVKEGEADYLVPERVWQEFAKGLAEPHAELMFDVLRQSGVLQKLAPEVKATPRNFAGSVAARFALLTWPLEEAQVNELCERLRAPNEVRELALTACRCRKKLTSATPEALLDLLKTADAFRRPERFAELLQVARLAAPGVDTARIERALRAATAVDAGEIAKRATGSEIGRLIDQARVKAIAEG